MAETTHISWADHTFNPWLGCTKVSNGPLGACENCYAEVLVDQRFGRAEFGGPDKGVGTRARTSPANWKQPLAWDRKAARDRTRPFVFCASLADVFDNAVDPAWRADLFDLIRATPNLVWLLLTKRPQNIAKLFAETITPELRAANKDRLGRSLWPENAAIGFTAVTQEEFDRDWPKARDAFLGLQAPIAFWSGEPLMSRVVLPPDFLALGRRTWAITGGESGSNARPSHPDWFRDLREQCAAAGVAFHFKQWGTWTHPRADLIPTPRERQAWVRIDGKKTISIKVEADFDVIEREERNLAEPIYAQMLNVGVKRAGRTLDGVIHDARPVLA